MINQKSEPCFSPVKDYMSNLPWRLFVCLFFLTKTSKYTDRQPRLWNHQQHDVKMRLNCAIVLIKLCQGIGNH